MMTRIMEKMYVGDSDFTDEDLDRRHIDHVLNVGGVDIHTTKFYTNIHLNDDGTNPSSAFSTILAVLDDAVKRGWTTLICCRQGMSRSVFIVILWLERMGMSKDGAYDYVKRFHPIAQVNVDLWRSQ